MNIKSKLKLLGIKKYKIRDDGGIVVLQDVDWESMDLDEIPVQFYSVDGNFDLRGNNLKNLKNFPLFITQSAILSYNCIETLEDINPETIVHSLILDSNLIVSLKGIPKRVEKFSIDDNIFLQSLLYAPSAKEIYIGNLKSVPDEEVAIYLVASDKQTWDASLTIKDNFKALIRAFPDVLEKLVWTKRVSLILEQTKDELRGTISGVKFGI
jgi:hypothetical protein